MLPYIPTSYLPPHLIHLQKPKRDPFFNPEGVSNIYIRPLHPAVNDERLAEICAPYGRIKSVKAILDAEDEGFIDPFGRKTSSYQKMCKGYGFCCFETKEEAENAIDGLIKKGFEAMFARESITIKLRKLSDDDSTNLYLQNIPLDWTEKDLKALFLPAPVRSVRIMRTSDGPPPPDPKSRPAGSRPSTEGPSKGVGFARLYDRNSALEAISKLRGKTLEGSTAPLQIRFADTESQKLLKASTRVLKPSSNPNNPNPSSPSSLKKRSSHPGFRLGNNKFHHGHGHQATSGGGNNGGGGQSRSTMRQGNNVPIVLNSQRQLHPNAHPFQPLPHHPNFISSRYPHPSQHHPQQIQLPVAEYYAAAAAAMNNPLTYANHFTLPMTNIVNAVVNANSDVPPNNDRDEPQSIQNDPSATAAELVLISPATSTVSFPIAHTNHTTSQTPSQILTSQTSPSSSFTSCESQFEFNTFENNDNTSPATVTSVTTTHKFQSPKSQSPKKKGEKMFFSPNPDYGSSEKTLDQIVRPKSAPNDGVRCQGSFGLGLGLGVGLGLDFAKDPHSHPSI